MTLYIEKPSIMTLRVNVKPDRKDAFLNWQADFNASIAGFPGFVSLEFLSPQEQRNGWLIVQRFKNPEATSAWHGAHQYRELMETLGTLVEENGVEELKADESQTDRSVTEVIVTEVNPAKESSYRRWTAKIHQVEAKFPGFRGTYVQSPQGHGKHWITLLQFNTMENLDRWLQSKERQELLNESSTLISSLETHRVISPYSGWFASIAKVGELPPVWKQTMIVLLVLFPIVMFELKYLVPLTNSLNSSVGTFIGNAISVTLISFPMMPIAIWFLGWWLTSNSRKWSIVGTFLMAVLYLVEIAIFWNFL